MGSSLTLVVGRMKRNVRKLPQHKLSAGPIQPYKRSVHGQKTYKAKSVRSSRRRGVPVYQARPSFIALIMRFVSWGFVLLILFFILYWVLPWKKIKSIPNRFKGFSVSFTEGSTPSPLLFQSVGTNTPLLTLSSLISEGDISKATVIVSLKSGDSLKSVLSRHGFSDMEANAAQEAFVTLQQEEKVGAALRAGDGIELEVLSSGIIAELRVAVSKDEYAILRQSAPGVFSPSVTRVERTTRERIVMGAIQSSFSKAARQAGLSYEIIDELVDIFSDRISFHRDFRKGDRFTVFYHEHESSEGIVSSSGPILAAAFQIKGQNFTAIRYVGIDGKARYFNEQGSLIGNTFLRYPLKFSRISSHFSDGRLHPVLKIKRPHHGVDFAAPTGTPVRTVGDGVVTFAGRKGGHGIIVEIKHSDRYTTGYSHLSAIEPKMKRGTRVQRGALIGKVGMTGLATGPHLHFSLYDKGKYVNPLKAKLPQSEDIRPGINISSHYLTRAKLTLEHYQAINSETIFQ